MNIIKTLVLVTLITFSSQVTAFTEIPGDVIKPVSKQIERFLNYSELRIYDEIIVTVKFKLNADNKMIIISDNSDNYDISKFIKSSLNLKELAIDKKDNNKVYFVSVRFLATVD